MDYSNLPSHILRDLALEFGITMESSKALPGYGDVTYRIVGSQMDRDDAPPKKRKFVMKIQKENTMCSNDEMVKVIDYLHDNGFNVPDLITTATGDAMITCSNIGPGLQCNRPVKMYEFIEGETVIHARLTDRELLTVGRNIGFLCGLFAESLQDIPIDRSKAFQIDPDHFDSVWVIQHAQKLREHLYCVKDAELKKAVEGFLDLHKDLVANKFGGLRRGFIQGDFSDSNIILKNRETAVGKIITAREEAKQAFGIIDFQHSHFGWIVFEISITVAYMMTSCEGSGVKPNAVAREILSGFQTVVPLSDAEKNALYCGVCIRLAVSAVEKWFRRDSNPHHLEEDQSLHANKCSRMVKKMWIDGQSNTTTEWFQGE